MSRSGDSPDLVDIPTVVDLVEQHFPQFTGLRVAAIPGVGTSNQIFRIGDDLAARFPRTVGTPAAVRAGLVSEHQAMTRFNDDCPVASPAIVGLGKPGAGHRFYWSLQTWLPGSVATEALVQSSDDFADDLAELITALRSADTRGQRFGGEGRGGGLRRHDEWVRTCLQRSAGLLNTELLAAFWSRHRALPREQADRMCHTDLIPFNLIVAGNRLSGVLDTGGYGPADPSLDLVAAWHLLDAKRRDRLRTHLASDDLEWARGCAWAFEQAIGLVWYYLESNPAMARLGARTLQRLIADATGDPQSLAPADSPVRLLLRHP